LFASLSTEIILLTNVYIVTTYLISWNRFRVSFIRKTLH